MANLSTTDYIEGALGAGAIFYAFKKSGWEKWALLGVGAYFLYSVYQDYSSGGVAT